MKEKFKWFMNWLFRHPFIASGLVVIIAAIVTYVIYLCDGVEDFEVLLWFILLWLTAFALLILGAAVFLLCLPWVHFFRRLVKWYHVTRFM